MGHGTAGLLLSVVAGYWLLERAATHKGRFRKLGQLLGGLVIVVALVGIVCRVWFVATGAKPFCPIASRCPWKSRTPAAPSSDQPATGSGVL